MDLTTEIKKEYRNDLTWLKQIKNITTSIVWFVMIWAVSVVTLSGLTFIFFVLDTTEVMTFSYEELRHFVLFMIPVFAIGSASFIAALGLPKRLHNVFKKNAKDKLFYYERSINTIQSQVDTTESLLLQYHLITQDDINKRQDQLQAKQNMVRKKK